MSEDEKLTESQYQAGLKTIRDKIDRAQAEGNSKERDRLYQAEQRFIAEHKGNAPIVGSRQRYA